MTDLKLDSQELDSNANKFTLRCLFYTVIAFFLVWFLTMIRVFVVDQVLMTAVFVTASAIMLLPSLICRYIGTKKPWIKYMILLSCGAATTLIGSVLTFHSVLLFALPLFYAAQYSDKRIIYYSYIMTAIGVFISVMVGYFFGICDANMLIMSNYPTAHYINPSTGLLNAIEVNPNPWFSLPRYFVLPRCLILLVFVPVIRNISDNIASSAVYTAHLIHQNETDEMTQFFNKDKYEKMVAEYYPTLEKVTVIFWDINGLKYTNDTYGHAQGDFLITCVAGVIREHADDTHKVYRIGGDEFVMIIENPRDGESRTIIEHCEELIRDKDTNSHISISAAVGCATGPGHKIRSLIQHADSNMYKAKKASKNAR